MNAQELGKNIKLKHYQVVG